MQDWATQLRLSVKQLARHPRFAIVAIAILALGIGANTAIFTVVQSVLLAPLPYRDADRIVAVDTSFTNTGHLSPRVTGADLVDLRAQADTLEHLSYYYGGELGVQLRDHAVFAGVQFVSTGFPRVFGLVPVAGRLFNSDDAKRSALISESFAEQNFGSARAALGASLHIEDVSYQIAGVLPARFSFPTNSQVWLAAPERPESLERTAFNYYAVGRLKTGVTQAQAEAQLDSIARQLEASYPASNSGKRFVPVPLQEQLTGKVRPMLLLLLASVGIVLLIACVNVTQLMLMRATERQREQAIRTALGASHWQVAKVVVLEALLLAICGGALGILLALPAVAVLVRLAPPDLPRVSEVHLNLGVLAFTSVLCFLATVLSALVPARRATRIDPNAALKQDTSRGMGGRESSRLRSALVVAEVAASLVLAIAAGLLMRTMMKLSASDLGYRSDGLLVVDADAPANGLQESLQAIRQYDTLYRDLRTLPGVQGVAGVMGLPMSDYGSNGHYGVRGRPMSATSDQADFSLSSPRYFATMNIPLLRGRDFSDTDVLSAPAVAIISQSLARQSFGNDDPIGQSIECGLDSSGAWATIVGVVADVRQASPGATPGPTLYMPLAQHPFYANQIHMVVRTRAHPAALIPAVRARIQALAPTIATRYTTMDNMIGESVAAQRFRTVLLAAFAGLGLLLAMLGVYGVTAYTVAQRTFEIGIRITFGADRQRILAMVLGHACRLAVAGLLLGLVLSFATMRLLAGMLFGVQPADPVTLLAGCAVILSTAALAAWLPARRAAALEPMRALRTE